MFFGEEQFFVQPLFGSDCTAIMGTSLGCLNENAIKTRYLRKSSSVHGQSGGRLAGLSWIGRQRVFISWPVASIRSGVSPRRRRASSDELAKNSQARSRTSRLSGRPKSDGSKRVLGIGDLAERYAEKAAEDDAAPDSFVFQQKRFGNTSGAPKAEYGAIKIAAIARLSVSPTGIEQRSRGWSERTRERSPSALLPRQPARCVPE